MCKIPSVGGESGSDKKFLEKRVNRRKFVPYAISQDYVLQDRHLTQ
jgi:hypothetical protein